MQAWLSIYAEVNLFNHIPSLIVLVGKLRNTIFTPTRLSIYAETSCFYAIPTLIVFLGDLGKAIFMQTRFTIYTEISLFNHIPTLIVLVGKLRIAIFMQARFTIYAETSCFDHISMFISSLYLKTTILIRRFSGEIKRSFAEILISVQNKLVFFDRFFRAIQPYDTQQAGCVALIVIADGRNAIFQLQFFIIRSEVMFPDNSAVLVQFKASAPNSFGIFCGDIEIIFIKPYLCQQTIFITLQHPAGDF